MTLATTPQPQDTPNRMSSREVAELTGKNHADVMRDIRALLKSVDKSKNGFSCERACYTGKGSRDYSMYSICHGLARLLEHKYDGLARVPMRLQEESALKTIEQLLGVALKRQYQCLGYRIDGYDEANNIAYEIDEPNGHNTPSKAENDKHRSKIIAEYLGCKFIRIQL